MFGYWATGRPSIATAPTMTMRMAMTIATMGRPTKKRAMASDPVRAPRVRPRRLWSCRS